MNWYLAETFAERFWDRFTQINRTSWRKDEVLGACLKTYWLSAVEDSWNHWGTMAGAAARERFEASDYMSEVPDGSDITFTEFIE